MKKENWTEDEILAIAFESDYFERKSGLLLDDGNFDKDLAKALSAFANSDGGHIVLGAKDQGGIDGVPAVLKGRTSTKDWLEQKIPTLLSPNLQDFRVHAIERAEESSIPEGKVLLVIDVGKSDLAPHQAAKELIYYYRVGSHSQRAPHRYLELLFSREKFPGPRVANAWLQTVVNPLISTVKQEKSDLENERWGLDIQRSGYLPCVSAILDSYNSGNSEQFFLNYEDLLGHVQTHDQKAHFLITEVEQCHQLMSLSFSVNGLYDNVTSLEMLEPLKQENATNAYKFRECEDRQSYVKLLFSEDDSLQNSRYLVQCMINGSLTNHDYIFGPLWAAHRERFLGERDSRYAHEMGRIRNAAAAVRAEAKNLLEILEAERIALCIKYSLPFEEQPTTVLQAPIYPRF